jgi:hypothetical protein
MTWLMLIELILKLLPMLADLLGPLFNKATAKLGSPGDSVFANTAKLFDAAGRELWWWQFGKRSALAVCRRIALNRSHQISAAIYQGLPVPELTLDEVKEISRAASL